MYFKRKTLRTAIANFMACMAFLGLTQGCKEKPYVDRICTERYFLGMIYQRWIDAGRPLHYDPRLAIENSSVGSYCEFTNTVAFGGKTYRCRFAFRPDKPVLVTYMPPGTLAITDEGVLLWIRERDGRVFVSPDLTGIEP
jgi:hypothetical protein